MTLKEYIDEVKLLSLRYEIHTRANDMLIATYVNRGRQYAQKQSLSYLGHKYGSIIQLVGSTGTTDAFTSSTDSSGYTVNSIRYVLPADFIDITTLIVEYKDLTTTPDTYYRKEARALSAKEMVNIYGHSWNKPSIDRPTYYIENIIENNIGNSGKNIILAGLENIALGGILDLTKFTLELWYIKALQDLNAWTDTEQWLSPDLQELAIMSAMLNVVRDSSDMQAYTSIQQDLNKLIKRISEQYQVSKVTEVQELETNS